MSLSFISIEYSIGYRYIIIIYQPSMLSQSLRTDLDVAELVTSTGRRSGVYFTISWCKFKSRKNYMSVE